MLARDRVPPPRPRGLALRLLVVLLAATEARAADPRRVVVRVTDAPSRALFQRIRGQTSDLDLTLLEIGEPALEAHVGEEVATAARLARETDARVVVWFEEGAAGLTLFFSLPDEQRTLVRTLPEPPGRTGVQIARRHSLPVESVTSPSSATFESAALVVRSVLRALASGATIGVTLAAPLDVHEREAAEPPRTVEATPAETAPKQASPRPPPLESAPPVQDASVSWQWIAAAGWHAALIDARTFVQGGAARGAISRTGLEAGVQIALDAPAELADSDATVKLLRASGGAFVGYSRRVADHWRLGLDVTGGAVGVHRATVSVAPGVTRAPDAWLGSALIAPEAALSYRAGGASASWGIGLRLGADVVLTPPVIGNEVGGTFVSEHALSTIEPKGILEVEIGNF